MSFLRLKDDLYFPISSEYVPVTEVSWIPYYKADQNWAQIDKDKLILGFFVVLVIGALVWTVYSVFYGSDYKKAIALENKNDICKAPEGYTQEEWEQHMSHHPDRYKECLN